MTPLAGTRPRLRAALPWLGLAVVVIVALGVWRWRTADDPKPLTSADVDRAVQAGIAKAQQDQRRQPPDAATAFRRIAPSVVVIEADGRIGAGVVINAQGSILTALHVVAGTDRPTVTFADGTEAPAHLAASKRNSDIAVLQADRLPGVVVPAVMGGGAQVGDAVYPVGHPLDLEDSLSAGVVSAVDRSITTQGGKPLHHLIQFDAAVNPGNSGGPLLDRNGQVVGIVTSLANPGKQPFFIGVGFAVPIETAGGAAGSPAK